MRFGRRNKDEEKRESRHEEYLKKLGQARQRHRAWIGEQFANKDDVLRDARDVIDEFEDENQLERGTIEPVFKDEAAAVGYFLQVNVDRHIPHTHELVEKVKAKTGEWFEIEHKH